MAPWLGIAVDSEVGWPTADTVITFQGHRITLRTPTETRSPSVEIEFEQPMTVDEARVLLRRFMSSLAWTKGHAIREKFSASGGRRIGLGRGKHPDILSTGFRADYLPCPDDPKARFALALYREALGLHSVPYKFLGFFKIINILHSGGSQQREWIRRTLPEITNYDAIRRLKELEKQTDDVAKYLYTSGRCAVAHAYGEPTVNPDGVEDYSRLQDDMIVVRSLAEYLIEREFGVKSQDTVWREHLYELQGFREALGDDVIRALKEGQGVDVDRLPQMPNLSVRLRGHGEFESFENLHHDSTRTGQGYLAVICRSLVAPVDLALILDFANERMLLDPTLHIRVRDDGTPKTIRGRIDRAEFIASMLANGQLEVWQTQPEKLLGRCDPFVPLNIDAPGSIDNYKRLIRQLEAELKNMEGEGGQET